jgi:hypothetical protein
MKVLSLIFVLFIVGGTSYPQTNDECKYFQVITFIKTNAELNSQIKDFLTLDKKSKKEKFIEINISPWIQFIEFRQFKDKVSADSVDVSKEIISDDRLYYKTYYFEPYRSTFLESTTGKTAAKLYLTFSKMVGNTLLVEILNFDNHPNIIRRIGSGVKILFVFDQAGLIKSTLFARIAYN